PQINTPGGIKYGKPLKPCWALRSQLSGTLSGSGQGFHPCTRDRRFVSVPGIPSAPYLAGGVPCAGLSRGMYGLSVLQRPHVLGFTNSTHKNSILQLQESQPLSSTRRNAIRNA